MSGQLPRACAHSEDIRGGCRAERQPQHAPCLGAPFRRTRSRSGRPGKHRLYTARRHRRPARRAAGGALDLLGRRPRPRGGQRGHDGPRRRPGRLRARARRRRHGGGARAAVRRARRSRRSCSRRSATSRERHGADSAPWAFAARWATDWLSRAQRLAPPPVAPGRRAHRRRDARRPRPRRPRAARAAALHAAAAARGCSPLPVGGIAGLGDVLHAFGPHGRRASPAPAPATTTSPAGPTASAPPPGRCRSPSSAAASGGDGGRTATRGAAVDARRGPPANCWRCSSTRSVHAPTRLLDEDDLAELLGRAERRHGVGRERPPAPRRPPRLRRPPEPDVLFCGHCGSHAADDGTTPLTRVCGRCGLGPAHRRGAGAGARARGTRSSSSTAAARSAASRAARGACSGVDEAEAVNRRVTDVLLPGRLPRSTARRCSCTCSSTPRAATARAGARRPAVGGVRHPLRARIGPCGPPRAALLVLSDSGLG